MAIRTARKGKTARRRAPARAPQPAAEAPEAPVSTRGSYTVVDELAKTKARPHQAFVPMVRADGRRINDLQTFVMEPGVPLPVPKVVALQFARVETFTVRNPHGAKVKPSAPKDMVDGRVKLDPGQIVAQVDELTDAALLKRAKALPGGDALPRSPKREDLVDFVLAGGADDDPWIDEDEFEEEPPAAIVEPTRRRQPPPPNTATDMQRDLERSVAGEADTDDDDEADAVSFTDDDLPDD